ncbi:MAG TPA: UDP-3-O-(3-hydroxymyristoyl)glucosamine N-acyltransferase, partial [Candidatus Megaira endosymbiont of Hartmannula sinica]|nr:UDP-3-O-(3-hydroxymyristoyl)glucosamine N-acyltransferase [Candidatus Megaera endosymbiont of Hartmannula sinica]
KLVIDKNSLKIKDLSGKVFIDNATYEVEYQNISINKIILHFENPYFIYAHLLDLFYKPYNLVEVGINHSSGTMSQDKNIFNSFISSLFSYLSFSFKARNSFGSNVYIEKGAIIYNNVKIGDNSFIGTGCVIYPGCMIGKNSKILPGSVISNSVIGDNVTISPNVSIGQEGFGFANHKGIYKDIYHISAVIIGDNVTIGAGTTIDRGSLDNTIIEDDCRIDNLVQIAHNVRIGKGTVIAALTGISGSSIIGKYCYIGGQSGISGHINIADMTKIAGKSGVVKNVKEKNTMIGGFPAIDIKKWHKQTIYLKKLVTCK